MVFFTLPTVVGPGEGLEAPLGRLDTIHKVPGFVTEGRVAIVEHTLPPGHLAAPLHRHSREDELSIVLEGQFGAKLGDDVVVAEAGSYVLKPRGQWHTFWNAGVTALRVVELLIPGESEVYFQRLSALMAAGANGSDSAIRRLAAEYGIELDFGSVPGTCQSASAPRRSPRPADGERRWSSSPACATLANPHRRGALTSSPRRSTGTRRREALTARRSS